MYVEAETAAAMNVFLMITFPQNNTPTPLLFLQVSWSPQYSFSVHHLYRRLANTTPLPDLRHPRKGVSTMTDVYDYPALIVLFSRYIFHDIFGVASSVKQFCFLHFQRPPPLSHDMTQENWGVLDLLLCPTYCWVLYFMCSLCFNACLAAGCEGQFSSVFCLGIFCV